jgi:hypothetical protein
LFNWFTANSDAYLELAVPAQDSMRRPVAIATLKKKSSQSFLEAEIAPLNSIAFSACVLNGIRKSGEAEWGSQTQRSVRMDQIADNIGEFTGDVCGVLVLVPQKLDHPPTSVTRQLRVGDLVLAFLS